MTEARLPRELGVFGATMLGLGSILGTGIFVSIGIAAGGSGPAVILAIAIAAGLATCNALSSAQLAAAYLVSGGTSGSSRQQRCAALHAVFFREPEPAAQQRCSMRSR